VPRVRVMEAPSSMLPETDHTIDPCGNTPVKSTVVGRRDGRYERYTMPDLISSVTARSPLFVTVHTHSKPKVRGTLLLNAPTIPRYRVSVPRKCLLPRWRGFWSLRQQNEIHFGLFCRQALESVG